VIGKAEKAKDGALNATGQPQKAHNWKGFLSHILEFGNGIMIRFLLLFHVVIVVLVVVVVFGGDGGGVVVFVVVVDGVVDGVGVCSSCLLVSLLFSPAGVARNDALSSPPDGKSTGTVSPSRKRVAADLKEVGKLAGIAEEKATSGNHDGKQAAAPSPLQTRKRMKLTEGEEREKEDGQEPTTTTAVIGKNSKVQRRHCTGEGMEDVEESSGVEQMRVEESNAINAGKKGAARKAKSAPSSATKRESTSSRDKSKKRGK
jgi:hypothetical protein